MHGNSAIRSHPSSDGAMVAHWDCTQDMVPTGCPPGSIDSQISPMSALNSPKDPSSNLGLSTFFFSRVSDVVIIPAITGHQLHSFPPAFLPISI